MPNRKPHQHCNHEWFWHETKRRVGPGGGSEDLYYCRVCMGLAFATEIGRPALVHE